MFLFVILRWQVSWHPNIVAIFLTLEWNHSGILQTFSIVNVRVRCLFFFFTACEARTYFTNILYSSFYFSSPFFFFLTKNVALRTNTTHIQPWQMKETITSDDGKHLQVTQLKSTSNPWWWRSEQVKMRRLFKAFVEVFPICVGCVRDGEGLRF